MESKQVVINQDESKLKINYNTAVDLFSHFFTIAENPLDVIEWTRRWTFQAIDNATVSVDTFFTLRYTKFTFVPRKFNSIFHTHVYL